VVIISPEILHFLSHNGTKCHIVGPSVDLEAFGLAPDVPTATQEDSPAEKLPAAADSLSGEKGDLPGQSDCEDNLPMPMPIQTITDVY
jgi:hypothetical protein